MRWLFATATSRHGAEDVIPEGAGNAVAKAVILKVMAHVLFAQALSELGPGGVMVHVVVRVVVDQVAEDEPGEGGIRPGCAEHQDEQAQEDRRQGNARSR